MRKLTAAIALLAVALTACGGSASTPTEPFVRVDAVEFSLLLSETLPDGAVLMDLRTSEEIAAGYIEDAVQLDFYAPEFEDALADLPRDTHYLIYCNSGNRTGTTVRIMKDLGFEHVSELNGGIQAWITAELPLVTP